jgi:hypothetical protein
MNKWSFILGLIVGFWLGNTLAHSYYNRHWCSGFFFGVIVVGILLIYSAFSRYNKEP